MKLILDAFADEPTERGDCGSLGLGDQEHPISGTSREASAERSSLCEIFSAIRPRRWYSYPEVDRRRVNDILSPSALELPQSIAIDAGKVVRADLNS
jgi:hypothetical protein